MNCPVKLTISYDRAASYRCLVLRECLSDHNHRISCEIVEQYASICRLSLKEQHKVNELLSLKNNNQLKDHIHSTCKYKKLVTLKDIQNMRAKMREATKLDKQILDTLESALKDVNAKGVNEDKTNFLLSIFNQDRCQNYSTNFQKFC